MDGWMDEWMDGWMDGGQKTLFFPLDSCSLANPNTWFQFCLFLLPPTCQQATSSYHLLYLLVTYFPTFLPT